MGAWINFTNHIHIANESLSNGGLEFVGYNDISPEMIEEIAHDDKIERIQISEELPEKAYQIIDKILEKRQDIYFRILHLPKETFDISVLRQMPHLSKVWIDAYLRYDKNAIDCECLCDLPNLKGLRLDLFDRRDYNFINHLSPDLEELSLMADTMGGAIQFDCKWLLQYKKLHSLFLGKKAKKNLESISQIPELKKLSLRGIKIADFSFLKEIPLESFALLWCGNTNLSELGELKDLRELELWRIMKLEDLNFISSLVNLETLKLQDLKHVTSLPDLSRLENLRDIQISNVPIVLDTLDESVRKLIHTY